MVRMAHLLRSRFIGISEPRFVRFHDCCYGWPEISAARLQQDATYRRACVGFSPTKTFGGVYLSSALRWLEHYRRENQLKWRALGIPGRSPVNVQGYE